MCVDEIFESIHEHIEQCIPSKDCKVSCGMQPEFWTYFLS
jgi:hypothetical protein